jgi:hypothetical protein
VIQIVLKSDDVVTHLPLSFNGCWPNLTKEKTDKLLFPLGAYTQHDKEHSAYNFRFPVSLVREGWNEIVLENGGKSVLNVACIELAIRPKEN